MRMKMEMEMEMENEIDGEQVRYKTFVDLWILMWVSVRSRGGNSYLGKAGNWRRSNLAPRSGARTCSQMSPDGSANGQLMRTEGSLGLLAQKDARLFGDATGLLRECGVDVDAESGCGDLALCYFVVCTPYVQAYSKHMCMDADFAWLFMLLPRACPDGGGSDEANRRDTHGGTNVWIGRVEEILATHRTYSVRLYRQY